MPAGTPTFGTRARPRRRWVYHACTLILLLRVARLRNIAQQWVVPGRQDRMGPIGWASTKLAESSDRAGARPQTGEEVRETRDELGRGGYCAGIELEIRPRPTSGRTTPAAPRSAHRRRLAALVLTERGADVAPGTCLGTRVRPPGLRQIAGEKLLGERVEVITDPSRSRGRREEAIASQAGRCRPAGPVPGPLAARRPGPPSRQGPSRCDRDAADPLGHRIQTRPALAEDKGVQLAPGPLQLPQNDFQIYKAHLRRH